MFAISTADSSTDPASLQTPSTLWASSITTIASWRLSNIAERMFGSCAHDASEYARKSWTWRNNAVVGEVARLVGRRSVFDGKAG